MTDARPPLGGKEHRHLMDQPVFPEFPSELMTAYPVSPKMNKASFNQPEAKEPIWTAIA